MLERVKQQLNYKLGVKNPTSVLYYSIHVHILFLFRILLYELAIINVFMLNSTEHELCYVHTLAE